MRRKAQGIRPRFTMKDTGYKIQKSGGIIQKNRVATIGMME